MIYPILTEFEWGIAGIISIIIVIVGIRAIRRENREPEPHDYVHDEEFQKRMDEEQRRFNEWLPGFYKEHPEVFDENGNIKGMTSDRYREKGETDKS
jgi:hypothetical protein